MVDRLQSYWVLVEPMFDKISIDDPESFYASIKGVPRPQLLLFAAHFCLSEIWNGGFLQFFYNSTGLIQPEAAEGFEAIGMKELSSVVRSAACLLGPLYPRLRKDRWDAMVACSGKSGVELEACFREATDAKTTYGAFAKATSSLPFRELEGKAYDLVETEAGGFQEAATRYANRYVSEREAL